MSHSGTNIFDQPLSKIHQGKMMSQNPHNLLFTPKCYNTLDLWMFDPCLYVYVHQNWETTELLHSQIIRFRCHGNRRLAKTWRNQLDPKNTKYEYEYKYKIMIIHYVYTLHTYIYKRDFGETTGNTRLSTPRNQQTKCALFHGRLEPYVIRR